MLSVACRPSSFRESQEHVALTERQEAFLLERMARDWTEDDINNALLKTGIDLGPSWRDKILLMRSRLGKSIGRALVLFSGHVPHVKQAFPFSPSYRPMDRNDVEAFVEECERFVNLSDDLRRLARPEYFLRVITITEVPPGYGRKDIAHIINERCGVIVDPRDVIFRFKRWGRQSDACYVICPSVQEADHCVAQIQELAVPKRIAHGSLFGASFLWSNRASLFVSDPSLDFLLHDCKSWVFTTGWQEDMTVDEFMQVMYELQFYPVRAEKFPVPTDGTCAFFVKFEQMEGWSGAKRAMTKLRKLKWRWRIKQSIPFFAYPRRIDVHRASDMRYEDELSDGESDIEEPIHY